jgi:hypothetical protein
MKMLFGLCECNLHLACFYYFSLSYVSFAFNICRFQISHPKIADFGLARLFHEDQTHISTRVAGTLYAYVSLYMLISFQKN